MKLFSAIFLITLCCIGCSDRKESVSRSELVKYINDPDHKLFKVQDVNGINIRLTFQPASLMAAQELSADLKKDTQAISSIKKKYAGNFYFLLKYSKNNKELIRQLESFQRYSDMLQVLSFKMQSYINLTTPAKDTVLLSDYIFEQNYGMADGNSLLLVFSKDKLKTREVVEVNVAECGFGIGDLKFKFMKRDFDAIPELDFNRPD